MHRRACRVPVSKLLGDSERRVFQFFFMPRPVTICRGPVWRLLDLLLSVGLSFLIFLFLGFPFSLSPYTSVRTLSSYLSIYADSAACLQASGGGLVGRPWWCTCVFSVSLHRNEMTFDRERVWAKLSVPTTIYAGPRRVSRRTAEARGRSFFFFSSFLGVAFWLRSQLSLSLSLWHSSSLSPSRSLPFSRYLLVCVSPSLSLSLFFCLPCSFV